MKCTTCSKEIITGNRVHNYTFSSMHDYDYWYDNQLDYCPINDGFIVLCGDCFSKNQINGHNNNNSITIPKYIPREQRKMYMIKLITKGGNVGKTI